MSQFSNPSGNAANAAEGYVNALLDVLGDEDPVAAMRKNCAEIGRIVRAVPDEMLRRPEREGKWSIFQVVAHLADTELIYATRIRFPVAEDSPRIVSFDQDRWVRLWKGDEPIEDVLFQYESARRINLRFLERLTAEEWERKGMHSERGPESVRRVVQLGAAHDIVHRRQIERIRDALSTDH